MNKPTDNSGPWAEFLQRKPILTHARETLGNEALVTFLLELFQTEKPEKFKDTLAAHAFEEIGWPEGAGYCRRSRPEYLLSMLSPKNLPETISPRLGIRQVYWKINREEHMSAHQILASTLKTHETNNAL